MATLLIQLPGGASQLHKIARTKTILGRSREADINVPARGVSRRHCELRQHDRYHTLADLGSKNGTYVNDEPVQKTVLRHNDSIAIGEARIVYYADDSDSLHEGAPAAARAPSTPEAGRALRWVESDSAVLFEGLNEARPSGTSDVDTDDPMRRLGEMERELLHAQYVVDAVAELGAATSPAQLHEAVAARVFRSFRLDRVIVFALAENEPRVSVVYLSEQARRDADPADSTIVKYSRRIVERIRERGTPVIVSVTQSSDVVSGGRPTSSYVETGAHTSMLAPVEVGGRLRCVLQGDSLSNDRKLTPKDLNLFAALARALGILLRTLEQREEPEQPEAGRRDTWQETPALQSGKGLGAGDRPTAEESVVVGFRCHLPQASRTISYLHAHDVAEIVDRIAGEFGGEIVATYDLVSVAAFRRAILGESLFHDSLEAIVAVMLAISSRIQQAGGPDRAAQVGAVAAHGDLFSLDPVRGREEARLIYGEPMSRVLDAARRATPGSVLIGGSLARFLDRSTQFGDIKALLPPSAAQASPDDAWSELLWRGGSGHVAPGKP